MRSLHDVVNLYHPVSHSANTPEEVLVCTAIGVGFVLVVAAAASIGRPKGTREDGGEPSRH